MVVLDERLLVRQLHDVWNLPMYIQTYHAKLSFPLTFCKHFIRIRKQSLIADDLHSYPHDM